MLSDRNAALLGDRPINLPEADFLKLIHELQVHQVELELQNKELILAKEQAELAAQKFTALYVLLQWGISQSPVKAKF